MITLTLPLSPSRHTRTAKNDFLQALSYGQNAREVKRIMPQRYRVSIQITGKWDQADGNPRNRDGDSPVIPLMDAIAQAAGINDKWLNRDFSVKVTHGGPDMITVKLV